MNNNQIFFLSNKNKITIPYNKSSFERKNTKSDLELYVLKAFLRFNCTVSGKICTTLNAITNGCGYSTKDHSKKSNERFRELLQCLQDNNDIYCSKDIGSIKHGEYFELQLTSNAIFYCEKSFVILTMKEYETLINSETSTNKSILLATYLCIKKNIYNNPDIQSYQLSIPSNDVIKNVIGVSSLTTVKAAIADLRKLNMIYCNDTVYYYKDLISDKYMQTRNVYALSNNELDYTKEALKDFYQVNDIYTASEIDTSKIVYPKRKSKE